MHVRRRAKIYKMVPKESQNETAINEGTGFVFNRRRDDGRYFPASRNRPIHQDNRWIVPYNLYLLMKYDSHVNVEICSMAQSVKYIYNYVYKEHDRANVELQNSNTNDAIPGNGSNMSETQICINEIQRWQASRYISSTECCWRLCSIQTSRDHLNCMVCVEAL